MAHSWPKRRFDVPWTLATILDPQAKRVLARRHLPGFVLAHEQLGDREVVLLAPFRARAPHRLAVVDSNGGVRLLAVRLPPTRLSDEGFTAVGFAVDPRRGRVFLFRGEDRSRS